MKYIIDNKEYEVVIIRKNNKNTYIRIKDDLKIYVTTNMLVTKNSIKKLLDQNIDFLIKNIERQKARQKRQEEFYYLGQVYDIITISTKNIEIIGNRIFVKDKEYLNKWYKRETKRIFLDELDKIYNQFEENIPYPNLCIRKMTTRLNSELMKYSIDKLDYVIVHELSHFIHFNHSKSFWQLVSKYCPNYKQIRKELKD
jgi:predicted metal-dependent hydrolase